MNFINTAPLFEEKHFDQNTVKVQPHRLHRGHTFTDEQVIRLCGAPTGSVITVAYHNQPRDDESETVPPGLFFEIENQSYFISPAEIGVVEDAVQRTMSIY